MSKVIVIGKMDHTMDNTFESANRVYDKNGVCPTIPTGCGGGHHPKIIVDYIPCAMRGRNPDNPSDRTAGIPTVQRLEPHEGDYINTLTSVQKDNLIIERAVMCAQP